MSERERQSISCRLRNFSGFEETYYYLFLFFQQFDTFQNVVLSEMLFFPFVPATCAL